MTVQDALKLPSSVVTVMTAVPAATAVTFPVSSTDATDASSEVHTTFLFVAFSGRTAATRFSLAPSPVNSTFSLFKVTDVTGISTGVSPGALSSTRYFVKSGISVIDPQ